MIDINFFLPIRNIQSKVQQLYQLDQLLHEESGTMQSLQRDKEDLERALGGLRKRLHEGHGPPQALDAARKQQHTLERELSRVHQLLADNSKVVEVPLIFILFLYHYCFDLLALHDLIHSNHVQSFSSSSACGKYVHETFVMFCSTRLTTPYFHVVRVYM